MAAMLEVKNKNISILWELNSIFMLILWNIFYCIDPQRGPAGGGGGSHVACLNFKTSHVRVYKCFTLLSEIEQKFFVFVRIIEKGNCNAL